MPDEETTPPVAAPMETVTIALDLIPLEARNLILAGCDQAEDAAAAENRDADAYYQKVRDRLHEAKPDTPKVTIPKHLLTPDVVALIGGEVKEREKDAKKENRELHPHHKQTKERLDLR